MLMFSRLKGLMPRFVSKDLNDVQVGYRAFCGCSSNVKHWKRM